VFLRNPDLHSTHNTACLQSPERTHHNCSFRTQNPISSPTRRRTASLNCAQAIFWSVHIIGLVSAPVSFYRHTCARVISLSLIIQSHQLKTWLSRLPISSSRLSRKVQRQSGQHRIPVSFSRPLGQKDVTGRQSLASCSTSSLLLYSLRLEGFRPTPSIGSPVSEH